ncbi:hypothetical protein E3J48_08595 [Candidatus Aerophobetes bacterium]|uniref:Uncharacterized protein n=1 Tax=Aerophobetes bacterium TaxID=2030807 RepID=A0A523VVE2_UNCAE|nr:MAG: hypothetical protein E3J48_08595 [Candidatus Aerophobetes bacterium]
MKKFARWTVGVGVFLGSIVVLWYAVFSLTGMLWWNSEVTAATSLDPPKASQFILPDLSSLNIDRALKGMERSQRTEPIVEHQMKGPVQLSDDPRLKTVECNCGCGIVLADCSCAVALKQIEELGITKGEIE